jgi:nucleoside 2-deoxyribosyltransferase
MMKYENSPLQSKIVQQLRDLFKKHGLELLRADDKYYSDDLLSNIRTYMQGCGFGVAIFDRINSEEFNPNVSLEIGYMMALKKPILFLKDITLNSLQTDLVGKLYEEFDFQNSKKSFDKSVSKWLKQHDLLT